MSNDDYSGTSWMVYDAKNVDLSNSKGVILSRSNDLYYQINTRSNWYIIGKIVWTSPYTQLLTYDWYLVNYNFTTEVNLNTIIPAGQSRNIWVITWGNALEYWFVLKWASIARWQFSGGSSDLWVWSAGANITSHLTLTNINWLTQTFWGSYMYSGGVLYCSCGNSTYNNVRSINTTTSIWSESDFVSLDYWYNITYMSKIGDTIIIYANNWSQGKQYFWDWVSQAPDRVIDWYDKPILWGATLNNTDYIVTWTNVRRELFMVNGYQPQLLYETDIYTFNTEQEKFFFTPSVNWLETISNTIILPWNSQFYKFWNNKIGLPVNIMRDMVFWEITCIFVHGNTLYIYTKWTAFTWTLANFELVRSFSSSIYPFQKVWVVKTLKFDNNNYSQKKQSVKYRIWYSLTELDWARTTSINIYSRLDNQKIYANFYTYVYNLADYTTAPAIWDTYTANSKTWTIYDITKKLESTWTELKNQWLILHCTCSDVNYDWESSWHYSWTLTRATGSGDNIICFYMSDYGFKLIQKIDWELFRARRNYTGMYTENFNEIQFKFDLITTTSTRTPVLRDFKLLFNIIENDLS